MEGYVRIYQQSKVNPGRDMVEISNMVYGKFWL